MPMGIGPGLSVTRGGGGGSTDEAETTALVARFTTPPSDTRKSQINTLIKALKDAGVWSKLDALYVMAAADGQAARLNWVANQYDLTGVSSPTFVTDRGYTGDGSTSYLTTGFNPSTAPGPKFSLNSGSLAAWSLTNRTASAEFDVGGVSAYLNARSTSGNTIRAAINSSLGSFGATADSLGLVAADRSASNAVSAYKGGTNVGALTIASIAVPNVVMDVCRGSPSNYSARQLAAVGIGQSLGDTGQSALWSAVRTYLQGVGAV